MFIHDISRVALEIGPLQIRWYGLMFAGGALLYYFLTRWLWKRGSLQSEHGGKLARDRVLARNGVLARKWPMEDFDSLVLFLFIGLVVGARLGEVFFYNFGYYSTAGFWEIFKIWEGGLSSHGATIGLVVAYTGFWLWKRRTGRGLKRRGPPEARGFKFLEYADVLAVCMPLVAGFVRIGNFFNSEIVGRTTDSVFGVVFSMNGENFARHPAQLYEGLWAWVVFAGLIFLWLRRERWKWLRTDGVFVFLFVGLYFAGRIVIEFFKEYQIGVGTDGLPWGMTMGQALSVVPVAVAVGWFVITYFRRNEKS